MLTYDTWEDRKDLSFDVDDIYKGALNVLQWSYQHYGKDIVCAAVSSTVITSVNACLSINENSLNYDDKEGLIIDIMENDIVTTKIIESMISNLKQLEDAYPKNIQIKEENNE